MMPFQTCTMMRGIVVALAGAELQLACMACRPEVRVSCRSSSPSHHMRQLLTDFDSHITHARMLASPPWKPPPPPAPAPSPICPVNITFHGSPGAGPELSHGCHEGNDTGPPAQQQQRGGVQHHQAIPSPEHTRCGISSEGYTQQVIAARHCPQDGTGIHRQQGSNRRRQFGSRPRISAASIVPPEKVAEEALRQARIDYFADVQRIKQKRVQDWGQMFGQAP